MTKKSFVLSAASPILILILLALWLNYTHLGRISGLYIFSAFKAPIESKWRCAIETNARVADKFMKPLNFDQESKLALREYWHFSYYRECIFKAGFDFYGNAILPTTLEVEGEGLRYTNNVAKVSFILPREATLLYDNATDPDIDDYLISSRLLVGDAEILVYIDRSYKVADLEALTPIFAGFEAKEGFRSLTLKSTVSPIAGVGAYEDNDYFGYVVVIPNQQIVKIFGKKTNRSLIESLITSVSSF